MGGSMITKEKENYPVSSMIHPLEQSKLEENKLLGKLNGRKVMVFTAYHQTGNISVEDEPLYEDWAWVPKAKLGEYLDQDNYERIIGLCSRF